MSAEIIQLRPAEPDAPSMSELHKRLFLEIMEAQSEFMEAMVRHHPTADATLLMHTMFHAAVDATTNTAITTYPELPEQSIKFISRYAEAAYWHQRATQQ